MVGFVLVVRMRKNNVIFVWLALVCGIMPFDTLSSTFLSRISIASLKQSASSLLLSSPREWKIFATGLAFGSLLPIVAIIAIARKKLQLPWYALNIPWNDNYKEKRISVGSFIYNGRTTQAFLVKNEPKNKDASQAVQKGKFRPEKDLLQDTAILFIPGVGDTSRLMVTAQHEKLFPTDHVYVVELEDVEKKQVLSTGLGGMDEVLRVLLALRYLWDQDQYKRFFVVGESRGGAVLAHFGALLTQFKKKQNSELLRELRMNPAQIDHIIEKLRLGGFWFRAPLESVKATSQFMAKIAWRPMKYVLGPVLTKYRSSQQEPVDALVTWDNQLNVPTLYTPALNDEILGNSTNDQFFKNLKDYNGGEEKNFRYSYKGIHIKTEDDPEYNERVWNFFLTGNPKHNEE